MVDKISENMSLTHTKIKEINKEFLKKERRYNYTTPKSFLELIEFYKTKLKSGRESINN